VTECVGERSSRTRRRAPDAARREAAEPGCSANMGSRTGSGRRSGTEPRKETRPSAGGRRGGAGALGPVRAATAVDGGDSALAQRDHPCIGVRQRDATGETSGGRRLALTQAFLLSDLSAPSPPASASIFCLGMLPVTGLRKIGSSVFRCMRVIAWRYHIAMPTSRVIARVTGHAKLHRCGRRNLHTSGPEERKR